MQIRFWGTRGSVPTPGPGTVRYGGNTSCVEVRTGAGDLIVIDCGTGARGLGRALLAEYEETGVAPRGSILISHTHWDHIHGLPFFAPLFVPGSRWDIFGPRGLSHSLDRVLAGQMEYQYFPVGLEEAEADVRYHDLVEGVFTIAGAKIYTRYLNHPALTMSYRIETDGSVLVHASDHEPHSIEAAAGAPFGTRSPDADHVAFIDGADLLVHDTQYEIANYTPKIGWGHSTMEYVVDVAGEAGVGHLVMFHHDPNRDDDGVDDLLARARARASQRYPNLRVDAAIEGRAVSVVPRGGKSRITSRTSAVVRPADEHLTPRIVMAVEDPVLEASLRAAAAAEGLQVDRPEQNDNLSDAVVVIDVDDPELHPVVKGAQAVLGATRRAVPTGVVSTISDWLVLPCSAAHIRTKLRAAVLRRAVRWLPAPIAPDEQKRLASLRRLGLLDTPSEERFDRLVEMARTVTNTPIGLVTLVDEDRQWFKSHLGFDATESHRDESMCAHAILGDDVMQVSDALEDPRFADNPAVTGEAHVRFYAGAPLTLSDGSTVGTLCVADRRPRLLSDDQVEVLRHIAGLVVEELEATPTTA